MDLLTAGAFLFPCWNPWGFCCSSFFGFKASKRLPYYPGCCLVNVGLVIRETCPQVSKKQPLLPRLELSTHCLGRLFEPGVCVCTCVCARSVSAGVYPCDCVCRRDVHTHGSAHACVSVCVSPRVRRCVSACVRGGRAHVLEGVHARVSCVRRGHCLRVAGFSPISVTR